MFTYTQEELDKIIMTHFKSKDPLVLNTYPPKDKKKYLCLLWMIQVFVFDHLYSEKEVNEKIKEMYPDFVTIRRAFVDYGLMRRLNDGSKYWRINLTDLPVNDPDLL